MKLCEGKITEENFHEMLEKYGTWIGYVHKGWKWTSAFACITELFTQEVNAGYGDIIVHEKIWVFMSAELFKLPPKLQDFLTIDHHVFTMKSINCVGKAVMAEAECLWIRKEGVTA